jgi:cell division protein FtsN
MIMNKAAIGLCIALLLGIGGCSRQQSDWEKTRAANTTDSYEQFLKKYPSGEFTAQAQARVKELYEERDWQKARDTDTQEAYQAFLKQYPEGKWTEEARIRVENFTLAQAPSNGTPAGVDSASPPAPVPPALSATPPAKTLPVAPSPAAAAPPVKAAGSYGLQLGAFKSGAAANHRWTHVDQEYARLLAGLSPTVTATQGASGTLHRLQVTGLTETRARAICKSLQAKAQPCVVVHPGAH